MNGHIHSSLMHNVRLPFLVFLLLTVPAQAELYKQVDENGHVTYTNLEKKGKRLDFPDSPTQLNSGRNSHKRTSSANPSPANFPRIDAGTQQRRDDIRRQVLQDEISGERRNADEARRQLALGERLQPGERATDASYINRVTRLRASVQQHEQNVASIQRELANLK